MKFIGGLDTDLSLADITSVVAGTGMTGGATTGAATVNVIGGDGITANADDMAITAAQTTITSIYNASLKLGRDTDNLIDFATTDNKLIFRANNENQIIITDGGIAPVTTNDIDLGSASKEFKDAYFDGTVTSDAFAGPLTGDVEGNAATATSAATVTTAAQPAIESIGTDGDTLTILADELLMSNTTADSPTIKMVNTTDDNEGARLIFEKLRDDNGVAQGQNLGEIWFRGQDSAQNTEDYAYIISEIDVSTSGQESGKLSFGVAGHDGTNRTAAKFTGGSESTEVDAVIGLGANSVVSIPGNIDLAGDIDVDGTLETDALTVGGTAFTPSTTKNMTHHTIKDDIGTAVVYISLGEIDAESGTISNKNLPLLAPVGGKLLKIFVRTTTDMSGADLTWRLLTRAVSASTSGNPAVIGTATAAAGPTGSSMVIYDFTSVDSNVINAGDKVQISVQANTGVGESSYYITCLWEWDLS